MALLIPDLSYLFAGYAHLLSACVFPAPYPLLQIYPVLCDPLTHSNIYTLNTGERTGLMVRASDSGSGDPGSILGRVGVLFP